MFLSLFGVHQNGKQVAVNQSYFTRKFSLYKRFLLAKASFFHFGAENGEEKLKIQPVQ